MDKYSRILIYIFLFCIVNTVTNIYLISKINVILNNKELITQAPSPKQSTAPSIVPKPTLLPDSDIKKDLTLIKAELRSLREILNVTGSFEELLNATKPINNE